MLKKQVNGKTVHLTDEEERAVRDEWKANDKERKNKRLLETEEKAKTEIAIEKLLGNLDEEEKTLMKKVLSRN